MLGHTIKVIKEVSDIGSGEGREGKHTLDH